MATASAQAMASPISAQDRDLLFRELVDSERARAVALAYHLVGGDREAAKDVAQDAFLKAYRAFGQFRGEAQPSTWFYRILIRQAANYRRYRGLRDRFVGLFRPSEPEARSSELDAEAAANAATIRRRIAQAMGRLPQGQRVAFALVHLEGMSIEQAAAIVGRSPGTIKSHLHRALVSMRRELADLNEEVDDGD